MVGECFPVPAFLGGRQRPHCDSAGRRRNDRRCLRAPPKGWAAPAQIESRRRPASRQPKSCTHANTMATIFDHFRGASKSDECALFAKKRPFCWWLVGGWKKRQGRACRLKSEASAQSYCTSLRRLRFSGRGRGKIGANLT
jgi:hypothetical protein